LDKYDYARYKDTGNPTHLSKIRKFDYLLKYASPDVQKEIVMNAYKKGNIRPLKFASTKVQNELFGKKEVKREDLSLIIKNC
ncbi:hypothetical protein ACFL2K_02135, partial [Candidatus Margulisiibacteriota bacterium]